MPVSITAGKITHASAVGTASGAIAASTVTGGVTPYTFSWSSSSAGAVQITDTTSGAQAHLTPATYRLSVTDSTAGTHLTATHDFVVAVQTYQGLTLTPGEVTVMQGVGTIGVSSVTGGSPPYAASWSSTATPVTSQSYATELTDLKPGSYELTVIDTSGLGARHTFVIKSRGKTYRNHGASSKHNPLKQ